MKFKVEVIKTKTNEIIEIEFVSGLFSDAESVMLKLMRKGYKPSLGYHVNIKDC